MRGSSQEESDDLATRYAGQNSQEEDMHHLAGRKARWPGNACAGTEKHAHRTYATEIQTLSVTCMPCTCGMPKPGCLQTCKRARAHTHTRAHAHTHTHSGAQHNSPPPRTCAGTLKGTHNPEYMPSYPVHTQTPMQASRCTRGIKVDLRMHGGDKPKCSSGVLEAHLHLIFD